MWWGQSQERELGSGGLKTRQTDCWEKDERGAALQGEEENGRQCKHHAHTHQAALVVLGHLMDKLVQLQAAGAKDLDPEVVGVFRGGDVHFQELVGMETEVGAGD